MLVAAGNLSLRSGRRNKCVVHVLFGGEEANFEFDKCKAQLRKFCEALRHLADCNIRAFRNAFALALLRGSWPSVKSMNAWLKGTVLLKQ